MTTINRKPDGCSLSTYSHVMHAEYYEKVLPADITLSYLLDTLLLVCAFMKDFVHLVNVNSLAILHLYN